MLIAFHKPYGVLSKFTRDASANRSLAEFGLSRRVYPIGRLDADSEGLLLLSDEPSLTERLLQPRHAHEREYWVQVERLPKPEALTMLASGVLLQGRKTLPARAAILDPQPRDSDNAPANFPPSAVLLQSHGTNRSDAVSRTGIVLYPREPPIRYRKNVPDCWISVILTEGRNRQVRRMTAAVGHPTLRLVRARIGNLWLRDLAPGNWKVIRFDQVA